MTQTFIEKQQAIVELFRNLASKDSIYQKIIDLGKLQKNVDASLKTADRLVPGCQSRMYLITRFEDGKIFFETESDALISAGLGMLLTQVYSGESAETVLLHPPSYLDQIGIKESLTPGRANGLASLFLKMKQDALQVYAKIKNHD